MFAKSRVQHVNLVDRPVVAPVAQLMKQLCLHFRALESVPVGKVTIQAVLYLPVRLALQSAVPLASVLMRLSVCPPNKEDFCLS